MKFHTKLTILATLIFCSTSSHANYVVNQWKQGLSGSKLTSLGGGSVINSNSTLTVIRFCRNGRYSYYKEGSWTVPGTAGGASNNTITGRWDIQSSGGNQVMLTYMTDYNDQGAFYIYLERNNKVNIGGTSFTIEQGAAGC